MSMGDTSMTDGPRGLWSLPALSQEFRDGPVAEFVRGSLRLRYDYETNSGAYKWEELTFSGVEAFAFTSHESCTEDQVDAYDVLVEVPDSPWIRQLQVARVAPTHQLRHMRIYFDEIGCYEVAAADFEPPPARAE